MPGPRSLSNSAGVLRQREAGAELASDWVRPGIMLYGGAPGAEPAAAGLLPTMTLSSQLIGVQHIAAGDTVGYGSRFRADAPMRIGVVACGYPRHAPEGTPVLVDGVATRLVGRVSMDMMTVDLSPVPQARIGSPVTLWGRGLPIDAVAAPAGTIGYELMCTLAPGGGSRRLTDVDRPCRLEPPHSVICARVLHISRGHGSGMGSRLRGNDMLLEPRWYEFAHESSE